MKIYHAIYDKRDTNLSSTSSLPGILKTLAKPNYKPFLLNILVYLDGLQFDIKPYVYAGSIPFTYVESYDIESIDLLKQKLTDSLEEHNANHIIKLDKNAMLWVVEKIFNLDKSVKYKELKAGKKRIVTLSEFPEINHFVQGSPNDRVAIIEDFPYLGQSIN